MSQPRRANRDSARGRGERLPATFAAQLATLVKAPPGGEQWLHEIKYDGYRIGAAIDGSEVRLLSRNGKDWTTRFPTVQAALQKLEVGSALLDGEVTVVLPDGRTSFQALQNAFTASDSPQLSYFIFDIVHLDGEDLSPLPLEERKQRLRSLLKPRDRLLRYSDHVVGRGAEFFAEACRAGSEGIVSKRRDRPYRPGRGPDWLKTKCIKRQEFVVGGYTDPQGSRVGLGALLVGVHDSGRLVYCGKVGTGFTQSAAGNLRRQLEAVEMAECPFQPRPRVGVAGAHWTRPRLVAEVEFTEWTEDGKIRHPSFKGLREDKDALDVIRERPRPAAEKAASPPSKALRARGPSSRGVRSEREADVAGVRITHPERIVYPDDNLTKLEVARFYESIGDYILPHLAARPLTLLRCPEGLASECFFMKHSSWGGAALRRIRIREKTRSGEYLMVDSLEGLIHLVQMGVLEFHTWNSTADDLEHPDRVVFDLDPGPEVKWSAVVAAARMLRASLEELGLQSFVKTTGGHGLHVVVPLKPKTDWETGLAFSRALAESIERTNPGTYTTAFAKAGRERKILIDYKRNSRGSTSVAAFSTRARPSAPVSVPLSWDELSARVHSDHYNLGRLQERLSNLATDPWKTYWTIRQGISPRAVADIEARQA